MKFDLHKPCSNCPFLREGGVRLAPERVEEIAGGMLNSQGITFPCHKTTEDDEDGERICTRRSKHCAGALIFAEKNGNATQMMRIAERFPADGGYDRSKLIGHDLVFDTVEEMMATALPRRMSARKVRRG